MGRNRFELCSVFICFSGVFERFDRVGVFWVSNFLRVKSLAVDFGSGFEGTGDVVILFIASLNEVSFCIIFCLSRNVVTWPNVRVKFDSEDFIDLLY